VRDLPPVQALRGLTGKPGTFEGLQASREFFRHARRVTMEDDYCSLCHLVVAPRDYGRTRINKLVLHRDCLIRHQITAREVEQISSRKRFRLKDLFRRHPRG
jgi:hypothetical protein